MHHKDQLVARAYRPYELPTRVIRNVKGKQLDMTVPLPTILFKTVGPRHYPAASINIPSNTHPRASKYSIVCPELVVPGYAPIHADTNDNVTIAMGCYKRFLRDLPTPVASLLLEFAGYVRDHVQQTYQPLLHYPSFYEWVESLKVPICKKKQFIETYERNGGQWPSLKQCRNVHMFGKTEVFSEYKQLRLINSRIDAWKVKFGPIAKAIEDVVYAGGNATFNPFIKHFKVSDRPALIADLIQVGMKYMGSDYTSFESHFVPEFMRVCECELYRHMLKYFPWEAKRIEDVLTGINVCNAPSGVRVTVPGRRMSGEMTTSLGNGFTNLMLVSFVMHKMGAKWRGYVEGDDGIFASDKLPTEKDFADLGFTIKLEPVDDPRRYSFCGLICGDSDQLIRDPRKFMQHFAWSHNAANSGIHFRERLMRAKALSACYETPHCPIVGALARRALVLTRHIRDPLYFSDGYHELPPDEYCAPVFAPSLDTRIVFAEEFGIPVSLQLAAEKLIAGGRADLITAFIEPTEEQRHYYDEYTSLS
jgi:hypothetical protein